MSKVDGEPIREIDHRVRVAAQDLALGDAWTWSLRCGDEGLAIPGISRFDSLLQDEKSPGRSAKGSCNAQSIPKASTTSKHGTIIAGDTEHGHRSAYVAPCTEVSSDQSHT